MSYQFITPKYSIVDSMGDTAIKRTQEISDQFLDDCAANRHASSQTNMGEFHQFASVPTAVVEQWLREGFDIYQESARAILSRLRKEDLNAFITTNKVF